MEITFIKLKRIRDQQKLVAVADVTIDGLIVIHDIKVLSNKDNSLFIAMPSKKKPNGTFSDIVHPISVSARSIFEKLLIPATEIMIKEKCNYLQYTKGVYDYFRRGRSERELHEYKQWNKNPRLDKTIEKIPMYTQYVLREVA